MTRQALVCRGGTHDAENHESSDRRSNTGRADRTFSRFRDGRARSICNRSSLLSRTRQEIKEAHQANTGARPESTLKVTEQARNLSQPSDCRCLRLSRPAAHLCHRSVCDEENQLTDEQLRILRFAARQAYLHVWKVEWGLQSQF